MMSTAEFGKDAMIETSALTKVFGNQQAVDHLDWSVPQGSICGLLGSNGAGKTTILKMFLGMTHPTSGKAEIDRLDIVKHSLQLRNKIAFIPEDKMIYDSMSAGTFLGFYGRFFPDWSDSIAKTFAANWKIPLDQKIRHLSKGLRSKLLFSAVLSRSPQVLLLDEFTEGLDPAGVEEVLSTLARWASEEGRTAVIATHKLDEVERISDRIAILDQGKLRLSGDLDEIRSNWKWVEVSGNVREEEIRQWSEIYGVEKTLRGLKITIRANPNAVAERLRAFSSASIDLFDMNLREIYLASIEYPGGKHGSVENLV